MQAGKLGTVSLMNYRHESYVQKPQRMGQPCAGASGGNQKQLLFDTRTQDMETNGKTTRCGQGSSEKIEL